ncbi:MAG: short-chain dehydrogenase [Flammeovirgaceae bacterium]|nr:short-chain dehydrogenase [Flammeovirgaceae bacterium]HCX22081.1 short-chain dehydrogenase [Cytophagales bacterium]|tara:strand:- start:758 stop:1474 length:717 start_codon:yes stop_codon:yes gene_type:complete
MAENRDKLVVVTGGTKGIGRAIVEKFASEGYTVATCARNESDLDSLKETVEAQYGNKVMISVADLSNKDGVKSFVEFVRLTGKPVEVLVNNTGKFIPGTIHEEDEGSLEAMIETNLYSAYHLSRGIIPDMKKRRSGHIFNMCSIASITAYANGGSYSISKFAMYGMSKGLREEMKEFGVRVTSVMPGATLTASWEGVDIPEERFMKSEDVAEMVYATYQLSDRTVVEDLVIRPQLGDL